MQRFTALHMAAQRGDEGETKRLLEEGASPSAKDSEGRTPLHHAVMRGHLAVVELLMAQGPPELLLSKDILGCTPVHLAAVQNQVTLILMLVAALLRDEKGATPLHEIARRKCLQDFMGFLHLGWDIAAKEEAPGDCITELPPEWEAAAAEMDLTRPGLTAVRTTMGWSPLHMAAMEGRVGLIRRLVKDFGCSLTQRAANSWTPLHYAAAHNQVEAIEELVRLGCDAAVKDSVSSTPMHVAAGEGHLEAILLLVQLDCAAAVKDRDGCTPLYCAAAWNQLEAVRQLDKLGCPSWVKSQEGRTPVHVAAEQGWVELVELLVKELKNKVDVRDMYQFTPLHSAANGGHVKTIQKLIHFSHDVDVKDYLGRTPLHYAAMHGRVAAVEELVRQGASVREKDIRGGYTPLHLAADAGQCEAICKLAALGAPLEALSNKGWTPLALATFKGPANVDTIGALIELGSKVTPVLENAALETPLHIAARCGRLDVIQRLLRCQVPVNVRAKDGSYPLHYAAAFGQSHVVEALVEAGCPVNCKDDAQNTPLHLAAGCGFYDTVEKLVEMGADMNARDIMACTPLQNAAHGTYSALAAVPAAGGATANGGTQGQQRSNGHGPPSASGNDGQALQHNLTPAQTATQLALSTGSTARNGRVPVRTGLAWASLGLAGTGADWTSSLWGTMATGTEAEASSHAGMGLMQLLKRATRRRNGTNPASATADYALGLSLKGEMDRAVDGGLEALLRRSEALRAGGLEQDRSRLLTVASRLVELGAQVDARDAEGRTALHLAAGCGDSAMVLQLVQLGSDVNCRDSVGGTPMHHAAMANKKDMMFELARLGCDWRARADGIDGATAAFVLCGQHGKTTRQQRLVEAKLKRVQQEGSAARSQGQQLASLADVTEVAEDEGDAGALADANMAALLEQVQLEDQGSKLAALAKKRRKKKKPPKGRSVLSDDKASEDGLLDDLSHEPLTPTEEDGAPPADAPASYAAHLVAHVAAAVAGAEDSDGMDEAGDAAEMQAGVADDRAPGGQAAGGEADSETSAKADAADLEVSQQPVPDAATQQQDCARTGLETAIALAMCELDSTKESSNREREAALEEAGQCMDEAIAAATAAGVSAKYGKKVRRRLQGALDLLQGNAAPANPPTPQPIISPRNRPAVWGFDEGDLEAAAAGKLPANGHAHGSDPEASGKAAAVAVHNGTCPQADSPRTPVGKSAAGLLGGPRLAEHRVADKPRPGLDKRALDRGQEVQKPVAQAGVSRTPKRVVVAATDPLPTASLNPPSAIDVSQWPKHSVVPAAVAVKVSAPGLSAPLSQPWTAPPSSAYSQAPRPGPAEQPLVGRQSPAPPPERYNSHAAPAASQQLQYGTQTRPGPSQHRPSLGPLPAGHWQAPSPGHMSELQRNGPQEQGHAALHVPNGGSGGAAQEQQLLRGTVFPGAKLQASQYGQPFPEPQMNGVGLDHVRQPVGPHTSQTLGSLQQQAGNSVLGASAARFSSDLSASAPLWLPPGASRPLQQPQAGPEPGLGLPLQRAVPPAGSMHNASHLDSRSRMPSPGPLPVDWQVQAQQAAVHSLGLTPAAASSSLGGDGYARAPSVSRDAFAAFAGRPVQEQGSLYSWSTAPALIPPTSSASHIWQQQRREDSNPWAVSGRLLSGGPGSLQDSRLAVGSGGLAHVGASGKSPEYAPPVDNSIGSQLAASVLSSEDMRHSLAGFSSASSLSIAQPGYGQLW